LYIFAAIWPSDVFFLNFLFCFLFFFFFCPIPDKKEAERMEIFLQKQGFKVAAIHGDRAQHLRTAALASFRSGECRILVATDVAARGLDIPGVTHVVNATFPLTIEDYVHRIGRTGRAGKEGISHTLFTANEKGLAGALQNILRTANQHVPEDLLKFGSAVKKKEHKAYGNFFKVSSLFLSPFVFFIVLVLTWRADDIVSAGNKSG
jgi:superfamily II DNA/RNA helicase